MTSNQIRGDNHFLTQALLSAVFALCLVFGPQPSSAQDEDSGTSFDDLFGDSESEQAESQSAATSPAKPSTKPASKAAPKGESGPTQPAEKAQAQTQPESRGGSGAGSADDVETVEVDDPEEATVPAAKASPGHRRIDEIVVTAQKREQALQDVPMSITAVAGEKLIDMGAENFTDYADTVPALNFHYRGEGQGRINLRGLQGIVGVPTVAYLVDGVEQSAGGNTDVELFDIQRVEILRGPQGTLYGAGAVGGAISIVTNPPDPNSFDLHALGGIEQNQPGAVAWKGNMMVNVPLIADKLGARFVAFTRQQEGYIDFRQIDEPPQYSPDTLLKSDANTVDVSGIRGALTWFVNDSLEINFRGYTQDTHVGTGPAVSPSLEQEYGRYNYAEGSSPINGIFTDNLYDQFSVDLDWDLGWATMESLTGYAHVIQDTLVALFLRGSLLAQGQSPLLADALAGSGLDTGDQVYVPLINDHDIYNQEIRFVSNAVGPLLWTAGLFIKIEDRYAFADQLLGQMRESIGTIQLETDSDQLALYGQVEYAFNQSWSALLGMRLFYEELGFVYNLDDTTRRYDDFSPKLSVFNHFSEDVLIYGTIAKGFRSGGVNPKESDPPPEGFQPEYDPDELWSYEIGANTTLLDGRLVFNAALFYADWLNLQQEVFVVYPQGNTQRLVLNAGEAHSLGLEWEVTALLTDRLTATFGGALLESEIDQELVNPNNTDDIIPAGTSLENVPDYSANASLSYELPLGRFLLSSTLAATTRGKSHGDILNSEDTYTQPHSMLNVRSKLMSGDGRWDVTAYLDNVLNSEKPTYAFNVQDSVFLQEPQTFGLRFSYRL